MFHPLRAARITLATLLFASAPAFADTIAIDFEHLPGADGRLGTADDIATPNTFIQGLSNQFSSLGLTFNQGTLFQADFYDGNPNNHFINSTNPIATLSVPVYGISIQSKSFWNATLTAYDAQNQVLASHTLINPNEGNGFFFGTVAISANQAIHHFSVLPADPARILNLDNLVLTTSPVPEPAQYLLFGAGLLVLAARVRQQRK
jgi:hypothetical protein